MKETGYKPGEWRAVCDICGFEYLASSLQEDSWGRRVCKLDNDSRNPQEFVRMRPEVHGVPWARPKEASLLAPVFWANSRGWNKDWTNSIGFTVLWQNS